FWHFRRRFVAQVPDEAVQASVGGQGAGIAVAAGGVFVVIISFFLPGILADDLARGVEYLKRDFGRFGIGIGFLSIRGRSRRTGFSFCRRALGGSAGSFGFCLVRLFE